MHTALGIFAGLIGYNGVTVIVIPVVVFFGVLAGTSSENQAGWNDFGTLIAIPGIVTCLTVVFGAHEEKSALRDPVDKSSPLQASQAIGRNDQFPWIFLFCVLYSIVNVAATGFMIYLFKFVPQKPDIYSAVGIIAFLIDLAATPLHPIIDRHILRRYLCLGGMTLMACAYILFIFFSTNLVVVFVALVFFYLPVTCIQMTIVLTITDSVEYGQWETGKRSEAVMLSVCSMLDKIASALSNLIVGSVATVAAITDSVDPLLLISSNIEMFEAVVFYVPLVVIVLAFIAFAHKIALAEAKHGKIVSILEENIADASNEEN